MNLALWLRDEARRRPDAPALLTGARVDADYATFAKRAQAVAQGLRAQGVAPGDRVLIWMPNTTAYLEALYGILWAGAVATPIHAKLHPREVEWIANNADARAIFLTQAGAAALAEAGVALGQMTQILVDTPQYQALREADSSANLSEGGDEVSDPHPRALDDLAWLFYTSGTTGKPKGAMLGHGALLGMSLCYWLDIDTPHSEDAFLYAAPMSHGAGIYTFIMTRAGARHVAPESGGFDADEFLDLAKTLGSATAFVAPTMIKRLEAAAQARGLRGRAGGLQGEGLRTLIYGGGPMYLADLEAAIATFGNKFVQVYGQGEAPMTITALARAEHMADGHPRRRARMGSVGRPHATVEVRITDDGGNLVPTGEVGEVETRGFVQMLGYWRRPEATAATISDEGWLKTGDMGSLDADGFLTLRDRSRDLIIVGGTNVYPREIEEVLLEHPDVAQVAVIGYAHDDLGEGVMAFVVLRGSAEGTAEGTSSDEGALFAHCLARLARFKCPRAWRFVDALPINATGKALKRALRASLEEEH